MGRALIAALVWWAGGALAADWSALERYQQTITRAEFDDRVAHVYCPGGALAPYLAFTTNSVSVYSTTDRTNAPLFTLRFSDQPIASSPRPSPVRRIALDPGHIGGEWARMEERFFVVGKNDRPVQEAVLNSLVAGFLQARLEIAGAAVFLTRDHFQPVTDRRPGDFRVEAETAVAGRAQFDSYPPLEREAAVADAIRKRQEQMFYRQAEFTARARLLNERIHPDLTLCIHFNAVEWNERYELVDDNRLVVFVHGNYLPGELADDDQKWRLFAKLLERSHPLELALAESIASSLARSTGLPPVEYAPGGPALRVGRNPYVYARNLAANRLYDGPVVYLEPYYQNNRLVYQRLQLGDYEGQKSIDGHPYRSIFREYADAVAEGIAACVSPRSGAP